MCCLHMIKPIMTIRAINIDSMISTSISIINNNNNNDDNNNDNNTYLYYY